MWAACWEILLNSLLSSIQNNRKSSKIRVTLSICRQSHIGTESSVLLYIFEQWIVEKTMVSKSTVSWPAAIWSCWESAISTRPRTRRPTRESVSSLLPTMPTRANLNDMVTHFNGWATQSHLNVGINKSYLDLAF